MTEYASLVLKVDSSSAKGASDDIDKMTISGKDAESMMTRAAAKGQILGQVIAETAKAMAAMAVASINNADAAGEAAAAAGISVESYTRLGYAMKFSVGGADALDGSMKFLNKSMFDAANGSKSAMQAFDSLGVSYTNADGSLRESTDVMLDVADKFAGMKDGAQKSAMAMDIFGKSGADMVPFLNQGREGIDALTAQADKLGVTLTGDVANAAGQFNDNIDTLKGAAQGFGNQIMKGLLPSMNNLSNEFVATATNGDQMASAADGIVAILKGVVTVGVTAAATVNAIGNAIGGVAAAVVAAVSGDFAGAADIMQQVHADTVDTASATMSRIAAIWDQSATAVEVAEERKRVAVQATMVAVGGGAVPVAGAAPVAPGAPAVAGAMPAPVLGPSDEEITLWLEREAMANEQVEALREGFRQQELANDAAAAAKKQQQQERFMGEMMSLMQSRSKTLFNIGKAAAIANALIDAKASVVSAYKFGSGIGGPVLGAVFGGIAGAAQLANIASIKSQSFGGGGSVSSAGGGGGIMPVSSENVGNGLIAQPGQARSQNVDIRLTGIRPDDMISGSYLQKIIEGIGETLADNGGRMGRVELVTA